MWDAVQGMGTGLGLGLITQPIADARQRKQNAALMAQQVKAAKEMGKYNQQLALEMWDATNYEAQRKHMEKAGLNVGLMYGGAGAPGTTAGAQSQMPGSASPENNMLGMGMQTGMQAQLLKAQIENINADTKLKETDATKTAGVDTQKVSTEIQNIIQNTENVKLRNVLQGYQNQIGEIESRIKNNTEMDAMKAIQMANEKTAEEIRILRNDATIGKETLDQVIHQINTASMEQALRIEAQQLGLIKTTADTQQVQQTTRKIINDVNMDIQQNMREWDNMTYRERETRVKEFIQKATQQQVDFNTSTPQQMRQWTGLLMDIIEGAKVLGGRSFK